MSEHFEKRVSIREELSSNLIFGFEARLPIAIILGFAGYRHEVMPIMQTLSHGTRAYTCNPRAFGLSGFVIPSEIIKHLEDQDQKGNLERQKRYQIIDINTVASKLATKTTPKQKMEFLSEEYPSLYVYILEYLKMPDQAIKLYMEKCEEY